MIYWLIIKLIFEDNRELRRNIETEEAAISHELESRPLDRQKLIRRHMQLLTLQPELDQQLERLERSQLQKCQGLAYLDHKFPPLHTTKGH